MPPPAPNATLFPYTTLFRSLRELRRLQRPLDHGEAVTVGRHHAEPVVTALEVDARQIEAGLVGGDREQRRSEEHTSELQSRGHLVCRLLLEKKKRSEPQLAT